MSITEVHVLQIYRTLESVLKLRGPQCKLLALEIASVAVGLRPALLNDHCIISIQQTDLLLFRLSEVHSEFSRLRAIHVNKVDFFFIIHTEWFEIFCKVLHESPNAFPIFIDASESLDNPLIVSKNQVDGISWIVSALNAINQWSSSTSFHEMKVYSLDIEHDHPQPIIAFTGIVLGYPVVYCCNTLGQGNCLSTTLLSLHKLYAQLPANLHSTFGESTVVLTFTIPANLSALCIEAVNAFSTDLNLRVASQHVFSQIKLCTSSITQDAVIM
ncbi:hypothetical protein O5D80_005751 [Batrachochytrium dendrobatidis]|nr:hypothetical protein O5D80_005751 [Batrachochytrium dendrobatidis]